MDDSHTIPTPDLPAITRAIREYHAAQNSAARAYERLLAVLPPGLIVLHKLPDADLAERPKFAGYYWYYEMGRIHGREEPSLITGSGKPGDFGTPAVIVEAPHPRSEFLPELP